MSVTVRLLTAGDADAWHRLWSLYCAFYEADVSETVTATTWRRLLDPECPMLGLVAEHGGTTVGIVNAVLHLNTWSDRPVCYLEDLFVDERARGRGVARALIAALAERARREGWHRLYWMTDRDNRRARALYEKIVPVTNWMRYDHPL